MSDKPVRIDEKRLESKPVPRRAMLLETGLVSGARLCVSAIMLFERAAVEQALHLRVSAFALLQIDAPAAVAGEAPALTAAMLVNAARRQVSGKKAAEAIRLLQEAEEYLASMRQAGRFFKVADIDHVGVPHPHAWTRVEAVVEQHSRGFILTRAVTEEVDQYWIHDGDAFVSVRDEQGIRREVRWSCVEQYRLVHADEA